MGFYSEKPFLFLGEFFFLFFFCEKMQERYKTMKENNIGRLDQHSEDTGEYESSIGICLEKSLNAALDSFDNLFCRRCLVHTKLLSYKHFNHLYSD